MENFPLNFVKPAYFKGRMQLYNNLTYKFLSKSQNSEWSPVVHQKN